MEPEGLRKGEDEPWRVLEFYSGIGGMRYSLMKAGVDAIVVEAFDINDVANDVYEHNFGHRPCQGNIQNLSSADLDSYGAHVWLLSPPCQPYTRQGLRKGSGDARASSFLKILELIPGTSRPPLMLFVENVVGFETSDTHTKMIEMFKESNYVTQEFILSPVQFGVPYSRPRYFCLAKRKPIVFQNQLFNNHLVWTPSSLLGCERSTMPDQHSDLQEISDELLHHCEPVERFLEFDSCCSLEEMDPNFLDTGSVSLAVSKASEKDHDGEKYDGVPLNEFLVPLGLIERWGSAMDIVYPSSKRCCCFTKSYYRYVKGTGSLLATMQPTEDKMCLLKELGLRYFTPREVANLHSLPRDFHFPKHVTLRQRYALLGNSLSVAVVASLLGYLFADP